jgi:tetratricopeptide (TPR) repeat protein
MSNNDIQQVTVEQALQAAVNHQRSGQLQAAADLYRAILQVQPAHADANHNLGILALQAGQHAASLPFFKSALENQPGNGQYWLSYVEALILASQPEQATAVLNQGRQHGLQGPAVDALAQRAAGLSGTAPLAAAVAHREAGRFKEAIDLTSQWLAAHPDDAAAHALLAQLLLADKQATPAWAALNTALALNSALPAVQRSHARLLLKEQRFEESLAAARSAYQADSHNPESQALLAATLIANNQLELAAPLLASALHIWPRYAEAFANRAQLNLRSGDLQGALMDAQQALAIKPHLSQVRLLEISLHHQLGNDSAAMAALEQYLEHEPEDISCMMTLGERKRLANQLDEALALFTRATQLDPNNAAAWSNLGIAFSQDRKPEQAKQAYLRALELEPDRAIASHNLGAMALSSGELVDALSYFKRAIQSAPQQGETYLNLGHTLYDDNQVAAALNAYRSACNINASDGSGPRAALYMSILHYLDGELEQCAERLVFARPVAKENGSVDPSDRVYWTYVATLLAWHQQNPPPAAPQVKVDKLFVVGESHALAAHGVQLDYLGQRMQCEARWVAGIKQWHLGGNQANRSYSKFESVVARLPHGSKLLLCIGEIDCRHDEGILVAWKKRPDQPLNAIIENTVDRYIVHLNTVRERFGHHLIICGVPASNATIDHQTPSERAQFLQLIRDFNVYLRQQALASGMDFLDVHSMTDRGDGASNQRWHLDPVHLKPSATAAAFEHHLEVAPGLKGTA